MGRSTPQVAPCTGFQHEALFYSGEDDFVAQAGEAIRAARCEDAATLVVVSARKIERLRRELGDEADDVQFADMAAVGANPARIIPAWRRFAESNPGRPLLGIGEPVWAGRNDAELSECHIHESLLNVAFEDAQEFRLVCPYDTESLPADVLDEARCSHPVVIDGAGRRPSETCRPAEEHAGPFDDPLPEPPVVPHRLAFDAETLGAVREFVSVHAGVAGLRELRREDLALAMHELATNSVRHGGGAGVARLWEQDGALVCEVHDGGRIDQPLAGRELPAQKHVGGLGLWLVNQLCDLVQIRSLDTGTVVRVHMRLP